MSETKRPRTITDDRIYFIPAFVAMMWAALVAVVAFGYFNFTLSPFNLALVAAWMVIPNLLIVPRFIHGERLRLAS